MKIPLLGSLGIDSQTGVLIAIAGLATLFLVNKFGTSGAPQPIPAGPVVKGPSEIYPVGDDGILQRMGWTVPFSSGGRDYGDEARSTRKTFDADIRSRYEIGHPSVGGLTFLKDSQRHVSNSEYAYAARAYDATTDVTTTSSSTSTTPSTTDPKIVDLQNRILKMIVSRTSNVSTVLSNIDTIKASILTYTSKLQLAQQQVDAHVITTAQMSQYLASIAEEIAKNLQITLNPTYGDNSVPDYYQQYYQDYQKYINQLNSNYYDYYQPSYQYYPGQQYNYYQPYQYQYPNPYMSSGQYPVNYPYYGYYQQPSYYPDYSQQIDLYYQQPQQSGGLINIGTGGGGGLINIGTGGGMFGGLFG